jgi:uncharacterized membrane protein YfcA
MKMPNSGTKAFLFAVPIAVLGGLIGLGGAEFRLPVLMRVFQYQAKRAVPINLAISLVTVVSAAATRITTTAVEPILVLLPILILFAGASMMGAYIGTGYLHRLHDSQFEKVVATLLVAIGGVLIIESFIGFATHRVAEGMLLNAALALGLGLMVGIISSLLGVAGGELIIPALILVFGAGVKEAGTASLFISSVTILVGLLRYRRQGRYRGHDVTGMVIPMGLGSVIGSIAGAAIIGLISAALLKAMLGCILVISALKIFSAVVVPAPNAAGAAGSGVSHR